MNTVRKCGQAHAGGYKHAHYEYVKPETRRTLVFFWKNSDYLGKNWYCENSIICLSIYLERS